MVFSRAMQTGAVWLTAIMTLVAGTPHLVCVCPNGNAKPFYFALLSGKNSGCCDGSCCSASQVRDGKDFDTQPSLSATVIKKSCCCCKAHQEAARNESRTDVKLGKVRCHKTLVEGIIAVPATAVKAPSQDLTAHLFVPALEPVTGYYGFGACGCLFADYYHWPPPTDLVTVLQRFLI